MTRLQPPPADLPEYHRKLLLSSLATRRSVVLGLLLLLLPITFLFGVIFKHYLHTDLIIVTAVYEWIGEHDRMYGDSSIINWLLRSLLLFGPLLVIMLNLWSLRIKQRKPSAIMQWVQRSIIIISTLIFLVFFLYLIVENIFGH